jgi:hypothetical protein
MKPLMNPLNRRHKSCEFPIDPEFLSKKNKSPVALDVTIQLRYYLLT